MKNPLAQDLDHVLAYTGDIWPELRGARLFLTGGTGFFGCWLLESFAWACDRLGLNATVTVLTRSPQAFHRKAPHLAMHPAIHLVHGDARMLRFPEGRFSHFIHAATAASAELSRNQPLVMFDTIVDGTRHALDFAVAAGVERFLLTSSGAIYGTQPPALTHIPESYGGGPDPNDPLSVYGEGKRAAELLCSIYAQAHGLKCLIPRCFAFVGPYLPLDTHFAIGNFIGNCLRGEPTSVRGDGSPYRSYLYAADLAIWLWTILVKGESCRPYNVGSERAVRIAEVAEVVKTTLGAAAEIEIAGLPRPGRSTERYVPATGRARNELDLDEWVPLEESIRRTAAWHTGQPELAASGALR